MKTEKDNLLTILDRKKNEFFKANGTKPKYVYLTKDEIKELSLCCDAVVGYELREVVGCEVREVKAASGFLRFTASDVLKTGESEDKRKMYYKENKPPLGCMPEDIWKAKRLIELSDAISRNVKWGFTEELKTTSIIRWCREIEKILKDLELEAEEDE